MHNNGSASGTDMLRLVVPVRAIPVHVHESITKGLNQPLYLYAISSQSSSLHVVRTRLEVNRTSSAD